MADSGARLRIARFRFFALIGLAFSALGAGWLFLVAWASESGLYENTEPSEDPGEWFMLGGALGFVGACVAMYGVATRSPVAARVGAIGQGIGAVIVVVVVETASERRGVELEFLVLLALVIFLDAFVLLWAGALRRSVSGSISS